MLPGVKATQQEHSCSAEVVVDVVKYLGRSRSLRFCRTQRGCTVSTLGGFQDKIG